MKNLKKEFDEMTDKEKNVILKSTIVCGVSVLVVAVLTKKHITNTKTIKLLVENNNTFSDFMRNQKIAMDDLSEDVALLKKIMAKNE